MSVECIFCKIVSGDISSHKIFENEHSMAFLDIYPLTEGMTLVIPKNHIANWWDMGEADISALIADARRVALILKRKFPEKRIGIQVEGLDVPHVHIKLLPFETAAEFRSWPDHTVEPNHDQLAGLVKSLTTE